MDTLNLPADSRAVSVALDPFLAALRTDRRPALQGFLARSVLRVDWLDGVPDAFSLRRILVECQAELDWAEADYNRVATPFHRSAYNWCTQHDGQHPAQAHRLPVEVAAAKVLNIHGHLVRLGLMSGDFNKHKRVLRGAIEASQDLTQRIAYRLSHQARIEPARQFINDLRTMRRQIWTKFAAAIREYRALRREVDEAHDRRNAA